MKRKTSSSKTGSGNQQSKAKASGKQGGEGGDDEDTESEDGEEEEEETDDGGTDDEEPSDKSKPKDGDKAKQTKKEGGGELDISELPEDLQKYIKSLRKESAKYRTKATNLETSYAQLSSRVKGLAGGEEGEDDLTPEQHAERLEVTSHTLAFDNAILTAAVSHGINRDGLKYFRFLVAERTEELGEGEELSEEDVEEIAQEVAAKTGKKTVRTSVTGDEGGKGSKAPGTKKGVTLEHFVKMGVLEKTNLRKRDPELYTALHKEAVEKRMFI